TFAGSEESRLHETDTDGADGLGAAKRALSGISRPPVRGVHRARSRAAGQAAAHAAVLTSAARDPRRDGVLSARAGIESARAAQAHALRASNEAARNDAVGENTIGARAARARGGGSRRRNAQTPIEPQVGRPRQERLTLLPHRLGTFKQPENAGKKHRRTRSRDSMTEERKRKKRSEKLSDSFVARLSREIGPSNRLDAIAGDARANTALRQR